MCGRKVFWPFVPQLGSGAEQGKNWRRVAAYVVRRPLVGLGASLALLAIMATGLIGTQVGLSQVEKFRVASESAVAHTGSVITSAGIVLAGVFAALGVLPLVTLGQPGLIVGLGVLVDTLVVRTIIVPSLFGLLGDRRWWPRSIERQRRAGGRNGP